MFSINQASEFVLQKCIEYVQLSVSVEVGVLAITVRLTVGDGVEVGITGGTAVAVGGSGVIKTWSLLCTLLGYTTAARIQPTVRTIIARMASGNHNCLILFTWKLINANNFEIDLHTWLL
jgi:hypothetical protein